MGDQPARHPARWRGHLAYIDAATGSRTVETPSAPGKTAHRQIPLPRPLAQLRLGHCLADRQGLLAWLRLLALDGDLAKAEPKTLRYRILHAAPADRSRRRQLKNPAT